jgi:hypothetical protein
MVSSTSAGRDPRLKPAAKLASGGATGVRVWASDILLLAGRYRLLDRGV